MFLDGLEDAYDKGRLMGTFAEDCADKYEFTREAQDAFAIDVAVARARREQGRHVRVGDRAGHGDRHARATSSIDKRRAAGEGHARQDPDAEARVPQGRHGHRRQLELDLRRRRGAGADARARTPRSAGSKPLAVIVAHATHAQEPGVVHHRAGRRDREAATQDRLDDEGRRSLRDQRGVRRRRDGRDEGARHRRTTRSTCTAAPARSAIRSAPRARASSSRCSARCASTARSAASRRCASAAARRRRWRSSCRLTARRR